MTTRTPDGERSEWYGGPIMAASFEFLTHIPSIGDTITLKGFVLRCVDRNDAAHAVILERVEEANNDR